MPFEIIAAALSALAVILLIVLLLKKDKRGNGEELRRGFSEQNERLVGTMDRIYRAQRERRTIWSGGSRRRRRGARTG